MIGEKTGPYRVIEQVGAGDPASARFDFDDELRRGLAMAQQSGR
jgi:hypothetical protein